MFQSLEEIDEDARLLKSFARRYRLKTQETGWEPGEIHVDCPRGAIQVFERRFEVLMFQEAFEKDLSEYEAMLAGAGLEPYCPSFDCLEAVFDPDNLDHVRAVFKVVGLRVPRRTSEKQRAQSLRALEKARAALQERRRRTCRTEEVSP